MDKTDASAIDIEGNLKELFEKESREERKADGRIIAMIVAFLLIFLAMYHAWVRKTAGLAGILVPAMIMTLYGGWVVILAKRDKRRRELFEKKIKIFARVKETSKMTAYINDQALLPIITAHLQRKNEKAKRKYDKSSTSRLKRWKNRTNSVKGSSALLKASYRQNKIRHRKHCIRRPFFRQNAVIETPNVKIVISCKNNKKSPFLRTASAP